MFRVIVLSLLLLISTGCSTTGTSISDNTPAEESWPNLAAAQDFDQSDQAVVTSIANALKQHADVAKAYFVKIPQTDSTYRYVLVPIFDGEASDDALGDAYRANDSSSKSGKKLELLLLTPEMRDPLNRFTAIYARP